MSPQKNLRIISGLNTLTFSALQVIFFSLIPFIAESTELSLATIISSFSLGSFLFLFASPYWSGKSDSWGRMPALFVGVLGLGFSTGLLLIALLGIEGLSPALFIWSSRILYGLTASAIVPVCQALQVDLTADSKSSMRSLFSNSMSLNIGRALGPLYLILWGAFNGFLWAIYGAFAWLILLAFLNFILINTPLEKNTSLEPPKVGWFLVLRSLRGIFSLALIFTSYIGALNFSLAILLQRAFQLSASDSGSLMAQVLFISAVLAVITQALGRLIFSSPWQGALLISGASLIIGSFFLGLLDSYLLLVVAVFFLSIGISILPPSYTTLMAISNKNVMGLGKRAGLIAAANTVGYSIGGGLAAFALKSELYSLETLLLVLSLLVFLNVVGLHVKKAKAGNQHA